MKRNIFISIMAAATIMTACDATKKEENKPEDAIIGKKSVQVENGRMSAEILQTLGQVSGVSISPDGKKVLYGVTYTDIPSDKRNRELYTVNMDGSDKKQITSSPKSESDAQWVKEGSKIAFVYDSQLWEMNPDGTGRQQISQIEKGIEGFKYSPDNKKVLLIQSIKYGERTADKYPDLDKAKGRIIDDLMYKHWDEWVETIPHPFVADYDGQALSNMKDILEGEPFECPMKPGGGIEQLAWAPNSKSIAYTCRKKTGKAYAQSTNSDIYLYNVETKETKNLTEGMMGYDKNPQFSPDGKNIAWQSMERDGYESDKDRLFVMNLESGEKKYLTEYFDYNTDDFCWNAESSSIYIVACIKGTTQLFEIKTNELVTNTYAFITPITSGQHDYASVALATNHLVALRHSMSAPNEVFTISLANKTENNISLENKDILDQITMGKVEERWVKTSDNKEMLTWVVYPPDFDPTKKYPTLLYCQGGPQSTVSQFWSIRWNLQLMAAHDYIVVAPNRRGLPGFGQEWNEQISGDYGGQNMKDYLSAIDALAKEPFVDETKLGCTGASYGGFSVYWLAGHHNKRFKAFLSHAGIFNEEAQYLETEEMWFANWDLGGPFWDKSNAIAQKTFATSPHKFVQDWDTPIMITCGELDYRILASQGMMAFNAAQLRSIPSRMLIFPDENHWISKPQNGVLFQREFFRWFDQWLK